MFDELLAPLMITQWGRRAAYLIASILGILLLVILIQSILTWRADFVLTNAPLKPAEPVLSVKVDTFVDKISDAHLFGVSPTQSTHVPITSLQLQLIGLMHVASSNASSVLISEAGQMGKVYKIGDSLPSGVRINAIAENGVILENAGRLEKLPLPRGSLTFQGSPKKLLHEE